MKIIFDFLHQFAKDIGFSHSEETTINIPYGTFYGSNQGFECIVYLYERSINNISSYYKINIELFIPDLPEGLSIRLSRGWWDYLSLKIFRYTEIRKGVFSYASNYSLDEIQHNGAILKLINFFESLKERDVNYASFQLNDRKLMYSEYSGVVIGNGNDYLKNIYKELGDIAVSMKEI
jgi:hypothetical protein